MNCVLRLPVFVAIQFQKVHTTSQRVNKIHFTKTVSFFSQTKRQRVRGFSRSAHFFRTFLFAFKIKIHTHELTQRHRVER